MHYKLTKTKGDKPQVKMQLLFVDFRGSSCAILEWFFFLRDDIAPGSVRRILSRVDFHVIGCFASFLYHLLSFFLFTCSLFLFYGLQGPARSAILIRTFSGS